MPVPFLEASEIKPGQLWKSCDGSNHSVHIEKVEKHFVYYSWTEKGTYKHGEKREHSKTVFAFQVRYYLDKESQNNE